MQNIRDIFWLDYSVQILSRNRYSFLLPPSVTQNTCNNFWVIGFEVSYCFAYLTNRIIVDLAWSFNN